MYNPTHIELKIDDLLIKMVTLTLEVYWLPIKKLVMLYARVIIILFKGTSTKPKEGTNIDSKADQPSLWHNPCQVQPEAS
jgi:hypothetical protein